MHRVLSIFLLCTILLAVSEAGAKNRTISAEGDTTVIYLRDYGLEKTRKRDCVKKIQSALEEIKGNHPKKLVFHRGEYHFYPEHCERRNYFESNTTDINPRLCAFLFEGVENLVIDGNGSTLIFHEQMQPFTFDSCRNIVLKDIKIDWEQPLIAQAKVLRVDDEFIEVGINLKESPFRIELGKILFNQGKSGENPWRSTMEFDRKEHFVVPQTGDRGCLGPGWQGYLAENIIPGVVRLHYPFQRKPAVGNFLVMRHAERIHSGIFIRRSTGITIRDVDLYHATGLGILAQYSENLTFERYRAIPNKMKKRVFGGGDDGLQISNCKGTVTINNCEFAGLMDDPVNVHGTSVRVVEIISQNKVKCRFMHHQSIGMNWGDLGDSIRFIENAQMRPLGYGIIGSFHRIDDTDFIVTFKNSIPENLENEDALENLTWSPDLFISNTHFKSCRARGVLVSTPGKVIIENNIFESSGSAILISGDANGWFESGAVRNVLIRNNEFRDLCNSSPYQFCEGIISVYPIIPELKESTPPFHQGIRIENNRFFPFDYPVLYARSADGISFTGNTVTRSTRFEPWHRRKYTFSFEACRNINIQNNTFSEDVHGKNILMKWTPESELELDPRQQLKIE